MSSSRLATCASDLDQAALPAHSVAIDARDARVRKEPRDLGLDPLGAEPEAFHVRRRALLARLRDGLLKLQ